MPSTVTEKSCTAGISGLRRGSRSARRKPSFFRQILGERRKSWSAVFFRMTVVLNFRLGLPFCTFAAGKEVALPVDGGAFNEVGFSSERTRFLGGFVRARAMELKLIPGRPRLQNWRIQSGRTRKHARNHSEAVWPGGMVSFVMSATCIGWKMLWESRFPLFFTLA